MAEKKKRGRPKKPLSERLPDKVKVDFELIKRFAEAGLITAELAHGLGIHPVTLAEWAAKDEEFALYLQKGKEIADNKVQQSLFRRAVGHTYRETTYELRTVKDDDGEEVSKMVPVKVVEKEALGDVGACALWLKNRMPNDWKERQEIVNIDAVPPALPEFKAWDDKKVKEEFNKLLENGNGDKNSANKNIKANK